MNFKTILYEKKNNSALITLNRPEKLNAWTPFMAEELASAINEANKDSSVGAIVMTCLLYTSPSPRDQRG